MNPGIFSCEDDTERRVAGVRRIETGHAWKRAAAVCVPPARPGGTCDPTVCLDGGSLGPESHLVMSC